MLFRPLMGQWSGTDPVAPVLVALLVIGFGAALGGRVMRQFGLPAVLGELLFGMLAGNVAYFLGEPILTVLREGSPMTKVIETAWTQQVVAADAARQVLGQAANPRVLAALSGAQAVAALTVFQFTDLLSRLGVIVLLFLAGLETTVEEMRRVGRTALQVAILGMIAPFLLGLGVVAVLLPHLPIRAAVFVGGILTATSVGITARVFRDLGRSQASEARIILGAAVIDDVLGLVVLAVVSGLAMGTPPTIFSVTVLTLKATAFLGGTIAAGLWLAPRAITWLAQVRIENVRLLVLLSSAFLFSWLADQIGLATIVGAFAAGLVLEEVFFEKLPGQPVSELLKPLESFLVPVFFVLMGLQVKLETFASPRVLLEAAALTVVAAGGKILAGLGASSRFRRITIGLGMMPRGEVGLIFASIGRTLGVVDDALFSSVVFMVMATTMITPPLLKLSLGRAPSAAHNSAGSA